MGSHIRQAVQLSCSYAMGLVWAGAVVSNVHTHTHTRSDISCLIRDFVALSTAYEISLTLLRRSTDTTAAVTPSARSLLCLTATIPQSARCFMPALLPTMYRLQVSFVKAITVQGSDTELALMCVFGALGALPLAVGRPAAADAVWIWAVSVCIIYGTAVISAHGVASPGAVWEQVR